MMTILLNTCAAFKKKQLERIYNGSKYKDTLLPTVHNYKCFCMIIILIKTCGVLEKGTI